ncbi:MAG TPA: hypothetical protein VGO96_11615 [Pyrinomonadaceae bacterium]|nr:hypothetical protein [Pyrinomonadaceae bacterium]
MSATPAAFDARGLDPVASQHPARQSAYTVSWTHTATSPDGHARLLQTTTRYQRADGAYKLVHTYHAPERVAGRVEVYFGFDGLGVFRLDAERKQLVFTAPLLEDAPEDVREALREDPRFEREEDVRGQSAFVLRTTAPGGAGYTEEYRAPALGGLLVKRVEESARGRQAMEPTELALGEPDASLFAELGQYPADYAAYERSIAQMERGEGREAAQLMRELMRRMQTKKSSSR